MALLSYSDMFCNVQASDQRFCRRCSTPRGMRVLITASGSVRVCKMKTSISDTSKLFAVQISHGDNVACSEVILVNPSQLLMMELQQQFYCSFWTGRYDVASGGNTEAQLTPGARDLPLCSDTRIKSVPAAREVRPEPNSVWRAWKDLSFLVLHRFHLN